MRTISFLLLASLAAAQSVPTPPNPDQFDIEDMIASRVAEARAAAHLVHVGRDNDWSSHGPAARPAPIDSCSFAPELSGRGFTLEFTPLGRTPVKMNLSFFNCSSVPGNRREFETAYEKRLYADADYNLLITTDEKSDVSELSVYSNKERAFVISLGKLSNAALAGSAPIALPRVVMTSHRPDAQDLIGPGTLQGTPAKP